MTAEWGARTRTEGVARRDEDFDVVLPQPVRDLGQVGGLAHAIDAAEDDDVGLAALLGVG